MKQGADPEGGRTSEKADVSAQGEKAKLDIESTGDHQEIRKAALERFGAGSLTDCVAFLPSHPPEPPLCEAEQFLQQVVPFLRSNGFFLLNSQQNKSSAVGRQQPASQLFLLAACGMVRADKSQLKLALRYY